MSAVSVRVRSPGLVSNEIDNVRRSAGERCRPPPRREPAGGTEEQRRYTAAAAPAEEACRQAQTQHGRYISAWMDTNKDTK